MKSLLFLVSVAALACGARTELQAQNPRLQVTMSGGRVTIIARDVPVAEILQEWARVGQTRIVNVETLAGPRLTIQLVNTRERDALDILLRSAAGYIAAPRPADQPGLSAYDRVTILASSRPPAGTASAVAVAAALAPPAATLYESAPPPPSYSPHPAAAEPDSAVDAADFDPGASSHLGAQPPPPQQPAVSPLAGLQPQLEGAQPRGVKLSDLLRRAGEPTVPQTSTRPGAVPGQGRGGGGR